jgi:hypothetical protein
MSISGISIVGTNASAFSQTSNCGSTLAGNSTCTIWVTFTPPSTGSFSATLSAADNATGSPQTISLSGTAPRRSQSITFTGLPATAAYGSAGPYTLNATASSGLPVTYSVTGPATIIGNTLTITGVGTVTVAANQAGNASYTAAPQVTKTIVVNQATPTIVLSSSSNPVLVQNPTTFTATVSGLNTSMPTGSVNFYTGSTLLGTGTLNSGGIATLTTSTLPVGIAPIMAAYIGDTNYIAVTSTTLSQVVNDYNLVVPVSGGTTTTPTVTALPGGTAVFTFTLTPTAGTFPTSVTLTASGLPTGATYRFSPAVLPAGSGATTVTLTVQLQQVAELTQMPFGHHDRFVSGSFARNDGHHTGDSIGGKLAPFGLALLLLPFAGRMRKTRKRLAQWMSILLILATMGAATMLTGCLVSQITGQSYNVTVTATAGSLSRTTSFTLVVK